MLLAIEMSFAQFSPGKLAKPHAFLEGTHNCTQCHEIGKKSLSNGCVECHIPLKTRMIKEIGFHADKTDDCGSCHPDHNSLEFQMVHWETGEANFDHLKVGYDLTGKHKNVECRKCHLEKNIVESSVLEWMKTYPNESISTRTLLGAATTCNGCHIDVHQDEVSLDCSSCHTTENWEDSRELFNHDLAKFILKGEHKNVACEKCHEVDKSREKPLMKLTGLEYQTCGSCHNDIHKGAYGNSCEKCHTTEKGWTKNIIPFDHSQTDYPLDGQHIKTTCNKCHTSELKGALPTFSLCSDCHADNHGGQFLSREDKGDCKVCHTVEGFIPTIYSFLDHQKTDFKLDGSHFAIPCVLCHTPLKKGPLKSFAQFKWDVLKCNSCHDDIHRQQFIKQSAPKLCESCHSTLSFSIGKFDHSQTQFPLDGEHSNVACEKCHLMEKDRQGEYIRYTPIPHKCENCHSFDGLQK